MIKRNKHLLELLNEIRANYNGSTNIQDLRNKSKYKIAKENNVGSTVISNNYTRELNLDTDKFEQLLNKWLQNGNNELGHIILKHTEREFDKEKVRSFFSLDKKVIRKKITEEQAKKAYGISKSVYEGHLNYMKGLNKLVSIGLNKGSAADYIQNFSHLMKGERFTRTLNTFSLSYFFENIYKDYDTTYLSKALVALELHIDYYEKIQKERFNINTQHLYARLIYEKYSGYLSNEKIDEKEQDELVSINKSKTKSQIEKILRNQKEKETETIVINNKTYKRDNYTISLIKILRGEKCQICGTTIMKRNNGRYIEAAHITPKNQKGKETLDNIILLCPNHHKEFDLNDKIEKCRTKIKYEFEMNQKFYSINLE